MSGSIGNTIRKLRRHRDWTLKDLADATGLSLSFISLIERDKRDPSLSNLEKIAEAFGLPPSILIFLSSGEEELGGRNALIAKQFRLIVSDLFEDDERFPALS